MARLICKNHEALHKAGVLAYRFDTPYTLYNAMASYTCVMFEIFGTIFMALCAKSTSLTVHPVVSKTEPSIMKTQRLLCKTFQIYVKLGSVRLWSFFFHW